MRKQLISCDKHLVVKHEIGIFVSCVLFDCFAVYFVIHPQRHPVRHDGVDVFLSLLQQHKVAHCAYRSNDIAV